MREKDLKCIISLMANGIEDLKEKNKGRLIEGDRRYSYWARKYGEEDSEMLLEKSSRSPGKKKESKWRDES